MKIHSFYDSSKRLCVDCSECTRGGNGQAKDKCSCGWQHKKGGRGACYLGTLMPGIVVIVGIDMAIGKDRRVINGEVMNETHHA